MVVGCADCPAEPLSSRIGRGQSTSLLEQLRGFARGSPGARQRSRFVERGRDGCIRSNSSQREVARALLRVTDATRERCMDVATLCGPDGAVGSGGQQRVRETDASSVEGHELALDGRFERRDGVTTRYGVDQL